LHRGVRVLDGSDEDVRNAQEMHPVSARRPTFQECVGYVLDACVEGVEHGTFVASPVLNLSMALDVFLSLKVMFFSYPSPRFAPWALLVNSLSLVPAHARPGQTLPKNFKHP
jgi:hypothetical protein